MTLKAHFDGKVVVLDDPAPPDWLPNQPVQVVPVPTPPPQPTEKGVRTVLDEIAELSGDYGLPADFSEQHDHYLYGVPKR